MLSIYAIKTASQAQGYYNKDNYYAKDSKEAKEASNWAGIGAERLGLSGPVDKETFEKLLEGKIPNGEQLGRIQDGGIKHLPGYDLTLSAPKSVSIMALVKGDKRIVEAHKEAVKETLKFREQLDAQTRVLNGGKIERVNTGNFVIAQFHHDTSRELEPSLHTHSVILNATERADGKWRSITGDVFFHNKMLDGMIYRSSLAPKLEKLGYELEVDRQTGTFEIKQVPEAVNQVFSTRRQQIEAYMAEKGIEGAKAAEQATLATRLAKREVDRTSLQESWQAKCSELGFDYQAAPSNQTEAKTISSKDAVSFAISHLSERDAIFEEKDILRTALQYGLGSITIDSVLHELKHAIKNENLLSLGDRQYTTPEALKTEQEIVKEMHAGKYAVHSIEQIRSGLVPRIANIPNHTPFKDERGMEFLDKTKLNDSQKAAANMILSTRDRIMGIQGYAGVGKTTMLRFVREYAEKAGLNVIGVCPKAEAANELAKGSQINSMTLSKFLVNPHAANSKSLIILDEASMASNKQIHLALKLVNQVDARLVLVGDKQQLAAVEAGKPFELLQKAGMQHATMQDIIRQRKSEKLLQAVHHSISGNIKEAMEKIGDNVTEIEHKSERLNAIAESYLKLSEKERTDTLILAPANKDRVELNKLIRDGLKHECFLKGPEIKTNTLTNKGLSKPQMMTASSYKAGDVVRFNCDYKKLKIQRGQYYQVVGTKDETVKLQTEKGKTIDWQPHKIAGGRDGAVEVYEKQERGLMIGDSIRWLRNDKAKGLTNSQTAVVDKIKNDTVAIKLANGKSIKLDLKDQSNRHFDHAYASTVHNAQGKTCGQVLVHLESTNPNLTNQRAFYVEISRAEYEAKLFTDDKNSLISTLEKHMGDKQSALELSSKQLTSEKPEHLTKAHEVEFSR